MALINPIKLLRKRKNEGKAVGAFNVLSLEMVHGVINAAEETQTPVMLQLSSRALKWAEFEYLVPMVLSAVKNAKVDIAVHLDHSQSIDLVKKAISAGFSSVMYDGSHFNYEKNVSESKEVVRLCKHKIAVEVEIGKVVGKEGDLISDSSDIILVEDVVKFYNEIKPDVLAVAFGTVHGVYKGEINLNYKLIEEISSKIDVPLVMHGTSGVPFKMIKRSIKAGITKVNVGTDLLIANNNAIRKYLNENPTVYDIRKINTCGINAISKRVKEYLKLFD